MSITVTLRHMDAMAFHITGNSTVCSKAFSVFTKKTSKLHITEPLYRETIHYLWIPFTKVQSTHWGRVTHICVGKQTIIGSDNGLSPGRRPAIIYTNAGILLIGPLGTNFSEISIKSLTFSFTKIRLKVSSAKWRPFCPGLNGLIRKAFPFYDVIMTPTRNIIFVTVYTTDTIKCEQNYNLLLKNINHVYVNDAIWFKSL